MQVHPESVPFHIVTTRVRLSRRAQKDLKAVPSYIAIKLGAWAADVGIRGLEEVRKVPGFHDEPLKGVRAGQRSIRLSRAYRAIYIIDDDGAEFVSVEAVNKHEY